MTLKIYIVSAELGAQSASFHEQSLLGGFVLCITPALSLLEAITVAEKALHEDGYEVVEFEKASLFVEGDWSHEPDIITKVEEAIKNSDVVYSDFYSYDEME